MNFFNLLIYISLILNTYEIKNQTKDNVNNNIKIEINYYNNNNSNTKEKELNLSESLMNYYSNKENQPNEKDNKIKEEKYLSAEKIPQIKKNEKLNKEMLEKEEFNKQIENFTLGDFTTLELKSKKLESIHYKVEKKCNIKFTFYLSDIEKNIDIKIRGPAEKGTHKEYQSFKNRHFLFYEFKADFPGRYDFYLDNIKNSEPTEISFAIKDDLKVDGNIGTKKLDKIYDLFDNLDNNINKMNLKQNMINKKAEAHNDSVNKHDKQILIYSIIEVGIMVFIFIAQLFYIKSKIDKI